MQNFILLFIGMLSTSAKMSITETIRAIYIFLIFRIVCVEKWYHLLFIINLENGTNIFSEKIYNILNSQINK